MSFPDWAFADAVLKSKHPAVVVSFEDVIPVLVTVDVTTSSILELPPHHYSHALTGGRHISEAVENIEQFLNPDFKISGV